MNTFPINDYRDYLIHYGVLNMKWGQRRYQNLDGSLTPLGREHYGVGKAKEASGDSTKKLTEAQKAIENGAADYKTVEAKLKALTDDCWVAPNYKAYRNDPSVKKRADLAADLGLEALEKMEKRNFEEDYEGLGLTKEQVQQANREWFLYEDQTIGMDMIADLINQGYSSKQVSKMIDSVEGIFGESEESNKAAIKILDGDVGKTSHALFRIYEGNWNNRLKGFADACEEIKKDADGKRTGIFEAYEDPDSEYYISTKSSDQKTIKTEAKLANINDKLDALEEKKQSQKYQKNIEKKNKLEKELDSLRVKTLKIRNDKLIKDKDPGFFARRALKKELKLEKQLAKINKSVNKLDSSIEKLTAKQDKYAKLLDSFDNNKFNGDKAVFKNDAKTREAMRIAKSKGWDALTAKQKELLSEAY